MLEKSGQTLSISMSRTPSWVIELGSETRGTTQESPFRGFSS